MICHPSKSCFGDQAGDPAPQGSNSESHWIPAFAGMTAFFNASINPRSFAADQRAYAFVGENFQQQGVLDAAVDDAVSYTHLTLPTIYSV